VSELAKALAAAQAEFPAIERTRDVRVQTKTGGSYTFSYAPLDVILKTVRPVLSKHGLAISQLLANVGGTPALKTMLLHEGGELLQDSCPLPTNGSTTAQEFGSLVTYMRRYALVAVLGIATEEDDDGNHASGNATSSGAVLGAETSSPQSGAAPDIQAAEEYLVAIARAQETGALPSIQVISFGKNKGKTLGQLTLNQLRWYAEDWKIQDDPSPYDIRLKTAAIALYRGDDSPEAFSGDPYPEVPF